MPAKEPVYQTVIPTKQNVFNTPLGCRIVFALTTCTYLLFKFKHHEFITLDITCRPGDVIYFLQIQRLLFASFAHTTVSGLVLGVAVCWRRFSWLEHQHGTLGFLLWFVWSSVFLHGSYCIAAFFTTPFFGDSLMDGEVHGLLPLLTANLVLGLRDQDIKEVWLWPLPIYVSTKMFPLVLIGISWFCHFEAHFDVVFAYCAALVMPEAILEPGPQILDMLEASPLGQIGVQHLQRSDAFVCRLPQFGNAANVQREGSSWNSGVYQPSPASHRPELQHDQYDMSSDMGRGGGYQPV